MAWSKQVFTCRCKSWAPLLPLCVFFNIKVLSNPTVLTQREKKKKKKPAPPAWSTAAQHWSSSGGTFTGPHGSFAVWLQRRNGSRMADALSPRTPAFPAGPESCQTHGNHPGPSPSRARLYPLRLVMNRCLFFLPAAMAKAMLSASPMLQVRLGPLQCHAAGTSTGKLYGADTWPVGWMRCFGKDCVNKFWGGHNVAGCGLSAAARRMAAFYLFCGHSLLGKNALSSIDRTVVLTVVGKSLEKCKK